jgi:phage terminase large subunit GpA-like protein
MRDRNDVLDCEVYAYAAALRAGMALITDWTKFWQDKFGDQTATVETAPRPKRATKPKRARW